jgi:hypothetical protein
LVRARQGELPPYFHALSAKGRGPAGPDFATATVKPLVTPPANAAP